tara:strand:+ start:10229 stop:11389 length:1161 start_codon:yes stop_codon:yes gene_type:complete
MLSEYNKIIKKIRSCLPKHRRGYVIHEPIFDDQSIENSRQCLLSSFVSNKGQYIDKFEKKLKQITGSKHVLLTNSGTSALFLSLKLFDVKATEILVPSMTFAATTSVILYHDAIPHFLDCEKNSPTIDLDKFEEYISTNFQIKNRKCINKKTNNIVSCIIPVHAYGKPVDIERLEQITKKYYIKIIEDGAGALGSYHNGNHVGYKQRASIISFNGNKIVTTGMGGAILLNNIKDYNYLKHIMNTARVEHRWKVSHDQLGYNLRMPNINASIGYKQLCDLKKTLFLKKKLFDLYQNTFKDNEYCFISDNSKNSSPNNWVINLMMRDKYIKYQQSLIEHMHKNKIYVRELWRPQHLANYLKIYPKSDLKNTMKLWKKTISLPSSYYIT